MTQPMTQQTPFEALPAVVTDDLDPADYAEADAQRVSEDHTRSSDAQYKRWTRFEQLEFLRETTTETFQRDLLNEVIANMSDEEFEKTYEYITRMWGMARDYDELERMRQIPR